MKRWQLLVMVAVVIGAGLVASLIWGRPRPGAPATATSQGSVVFVPGQRASAVATSPSTATPPPTPARATTPSGLSGDELAKAWLRAYLTRPRPDDFGWSDAIAPFTDPDLVHSLESANPDILGLEQMSSMTVSEVAPLKSVVPANGPTRHTSRWVVTVRDAQGHTAQRPFEVISYLDSADGRWVVTHVEHLPVSRG